MSHLHGLSPLGAPEDEEEEAQEEEEEEEEEDAGGYESVASSDGREAGGREARGRRSKRTRSRSLSQSQSQSRSRSRSQSRSRGGRRASAKPLASSSTAVADLAQTFAAECGRRSQRIAGVPSDEALPGVQHTLDPEFDVLGLPHVLPGVHGVGSAGPVDLREQSQVMRAVIPAGFAYDSKSKLPSVVDQLDLDRFVRVKNNHKDDWLTDGRKGEHYFVTEEHLHRYVIAQLAARSVTIDPKFDGCLDDMKATDVIPHIAVPVHSLRRLQRQLFEVMERHGWRRIDEHSASKRRRLQDRRGASSGRTRRAAHVAVALPVGSWAHQDNRPEDEFKNNMGMLQYIRTQLAVRGYTVGSYESDKEAEEQDKRNAAANSATKSAPQKPPSRRHPQQKQQAPTAQPELQSQEKPYARQKPKQQKQQKALFKPLPKKKNSSSIRRSSNRSSKRNNQNNARTRTTAGQRRRRPTTDPECESSGQGEQDDDKEEDEDADAEDQHSSSDSSADTSSDHDTDATSTTRRAAPARPSDDDAEREGAGDTPETTINLLKKQLRRAHPRPQRLRGLLVELGWQRTWDRRKEAYVFYRPVEDRGHPESLLASGVTDGDRFVEELRTEFGVIPRALSDFMDIFGSYDTQKQTAPAASASTAASAAAAATEHAPQRKATAKTKPVGSTKLASSSVCQQPETAIPAAATSRTSRSRSRGKPSATQSHGTTVPSSVRGGTAGPAAAAGARSRGRGQVDGGKRAGGQSDPAMPVAREAQIARLTKAVEDGLAANGTAIYIYGHPGTGKSMTCRWVLPRLLANESDILFVSGAAWDTDKVNERIQTVRSASSARPARRDRSASRPSEERVVAVVVDELDKIPVTEAATLFSRGLERQEGLIVIGIANEIACLQSMLPQLHGSEMPGTSVAPSAAAVEVVEQEIGEQDDELVQSLGLHVLVFNYKFQDIERILESTFGQEIQRGAIGLISRKCAKDGGDVRFAKEAVWAAITIARGANASSSTSLSSSSSSSSSSSAAAAAAAAMTAQAVPEVTIQHAQLALSRLSQLPRARSKLDSLTPNARVLLACTVRKFAAAGIAFALTDLRHVVDSDLRKLTNTTISRNLIEPSLGELVNCGLVVAEGGRGQMRAQKVDKIRHRVVATRQDLLSYAKGTGGSAKAGSSRPDARQIMALLEEPMPVAKPAPTANATGIPTAATSDSAMNVSQRHISPP